MSGNDPGRQMTATQAGIQMQQGITGIDDKKTDLSKMLGDALNYSLGLCMEFWTAAKAFRVADNDDEFEWIDARQLASIPEMIPAPADYISNFKKNNPSEKKIPQFKQLDVDDEDEEGNVSTKGATKQIELDVIVNIGEGLPNNKVALYNMVLSLSQIILPDEMTGQPKALIGFKQFKQMVETYLGIRIEESDDEQELFQRILQERDQFAQQLGQPTFAEQQKGATGPTNKPLNINPNIPGANLGGQMKGGAM